MNVIEKIDALIRSRPGLKAAALERKLGLSEDRISKLRSSDGKALRAWEALAIARTFAERLEDVERLLVWLIDDRMDELPAPSAPPTIPQLSEAQHRAIEMVEELDLSKGEVIRRLSTQLPPRRPAEERIVVDPPQPPVKPTNSEQGRKGRPAG